MENFIINAEIIKPQVEYMVTLRDISIFGASFYTNQIFHSGMKLDLVIGKDWYLPAAEVIRVAVNADKRKDPKDFIIAVKLASHRHNEEKLISFINTLPETGNGPGYLRDRRKNIRKKCSICAKIRETFPQIDINEFNIYSNGLRCIIDQYLPVLHEIEIKLDNPTGEGILCISGVVINCEKSGEKLYELEVFFPFEEREKLNCLFAL